MPQVAMPPTTRVSAAASWRRPTLDFIFSLMAANSARDFIKIPPTNHPARIFRQGKRAVCGLLIFFQNAVDVLGDKTAVNVVVNNHDGSQSARAYAAHRVIRELPVGGDAARLDAEAFDNLFGDAAGTPDIAGRAKTHGNLVFALRVERELGIKRDDPVDLLERQVMPSAMIFWAIGR
jgi:hypothetical protein